MKICDLCGATVKELYELVDKLKYYKVNEICESCKKEMDIYRDRVFMALAKIEKKTRDTFWKRWVANKLKKKKERQ